MEEEKKISDEEKVLKNENGKVLKEKFLSGFKKILEEENFLEEEKKISDEEKVLKNENEKVLWKMKKKL